MAWAYLTLRGQNNAYEEINKTDIFTGITLPEGIDRETLLNRIYIRAMEFSVMHTDPEFFHEQILNFFKVHYRTFDKWVKALALEYNPIQNYDRTEEYTGSGENENEGHISDSGSGTDTLTKAAFNSSSYEPYEKNTASNSSSSNSNSDGSYSDRHNLHVYGNIGVTTSQQMLESELELAKFNIYTAIADMFTDEFCIQVYI